MASAVALVRRIGSRLRVLDPRLVDGLLVLVLGAAALGQVLAHPYQGPPTYRPFQAMAVVGTIVPLYWRRRAPVPSYAAQVVMAFLSARTPVAPTLVAIILGTYSLGLYSRSRLPSLLLPVAVAAALAIVGIPGHWFTAPTPAWFAELVFGLGMWFAGNSVRGLGERFRELERERELATQVAVAEERARIARELHDVVAHSVSVMVVQAGAARRLLDRQPERAGAALLAVESSGREALTELRRLLGLLTDEAEGRAPASPPALAPQPGLGQLEALVRRMDAAGLPVEVRVEGDARQLPPGLDLTAYRVVQEALTNALKYARGARTEVVVRYAEDELGLEVTDDGDERPAPTDGTGRGLLGMRQRVAVYGGALDAGRRPEGGFQVRARIPLSPP